MAIKLEIGTRGMRYEFEETYTRLFLKDNGLKRLHIEEPFTCTDTFAVHTKHGYMCSFGPYDIITYMGDGIWDLKLHEDSEKENNDFSSLFK